MMTRMARAQMLRFIVRMVQGGLWKALMAWRVSMNEATTTVAQIVSFKAAVEEDDAKVAAELMQLKAKLDDTTRQLESEKDMMTGMARAQMLRFFVRMVQGELGRALMAWRVSMKETLIGSQIVSFKAATEEDDAKVAAELAYLEAQLDTNVQNEVWLRKDMQTKQDRGLELERRKAELQCDMLIEKAQTASLEAENAQLKAKVANLEDQKAQLNHEIEFLRQGASTLHAQIDRFEAAMQAQCRWTEEHVRNCNAATESPSPSPDVKCRSLMWNVEEDLSQVGEFSESPDRCNVGELNENSFLQSDASTEFMQSNSAPSTPAQLDRRTSTQNDKYDKSQ